MWTGSRSIAWLITAAVLASGCGSSTQASATSDATDSAIDSSADTDNGLAAFCQGSAAKVQRGVMVVSPAAVSSSELVLDCCMGVVARFHVANTIGARVDVLIRGMGGNPPAGDLDLAHPPTGLAVSIASDGTMVTASLSGTVRLDRPANYVDPSHVSICAEIHAPGSALEGVRLYVSNFPVAGWGAQDRLTFKLLSDPKLTAQTAATMPLASLALATEPVIRLSSIAWYEGTQHRVFWDQLATTAALRNKVGNVGTQGVPFVVEADGERIYLGTFYSLISSQTFPGPTIVMENLSPDGFTIDPAYPAPMTGTDLRSDPRILKVLTETGKRVP